MLDDAAKQKAARVAVAEVQQHHAVWSMAQLRFEVHRALPVLPAGADADAVITEVAGLAVSGRAVDSEPGNDGGGVLVVVIEVRCASVGERKDRDDPHVHLPPVGAQGPAQPTLD